MAKQQIYLTPGGRKAYAKIEVATRTVLKTRVNWPTAVDDQTIVGDDGTIRFLPMVEDPLLTGEELDKANFTQSTITPASGSDAIAQALEAGEYYIQRPVAKRSSSDIKTEVSNYERALRAQIVPDVDQSRDNTLIIAALTQKIDGLVTTPELQAAIDRNLERANKLSANLAVEKDLHAAIDEGQTVSIADAPWTKAE